LVDTPDEMRIFVRYGNEVAFLTSTILVQAVHHASEHRAQISDILAANKMDVLNLDEIDLWSFEKWEKSN
jgi:DNA replication protein DnaC